MIKKIILIQPRHIYAPNPEIEPLGHIYMPTSLLAAASNLLNAGLDVSILDENIEPHFFDNRVMGINLLGAPYIPMAIQYARNLRHRFKNKFLLIIGGQVVSGLSNNQIEKLFGLNVIDGNKIERVSKNLNVETNKLKRAEKLSLIPAYKKLSDYYMQLYLNREFGFYLSRGCKYSCNFCAAKKIFYGKASKKLINNKEIYRDLDIACGDLEYLILTAQHFGIKSMNLYLSNLDLFQNPLILGHFAEKIIQLKKKNNNFQLNLRGLSNVRSFLNTNKSHPDVILKMITAGLYRVGFGVDGATPNIWEKTRKPQTKAECIEAMNIAKNIYGLVIENLMVFGYNKYEDDLSLQSTYEFTREIYNNYGALPRPHVAKDIIPGNDGWCDKKNETIVNHFINNPILFQNLDFTALPSPYTHPNNKFRAMVEDCYLKICSLPYSLTQYVKPIGLNMSKEEIYKVNDFNSKRYDI